MDEPEKRYFVYVAIGATIAEDVAVRGLLEKLYAKHDMMESLLVELMEDRNPVDVLVGFHLAALVAHNDGTNL